MGVGALLETELEFEHAVLYTLRLQPAALLAPRAEPAVVAQLRARLERTHPRRTLRTLVALRAEPAVTTEHSKRFRRTDPVSTYGTVVFAAAKPAVVAKLRREVGVTDPLPASRSRHDEDGRWESVRDDGVR